MLRQHHRAPVLCAALLLSTSFASPAIAQNSLSSASKAGGGYRFEVTTVKPVETHGDITVGTDIDPGGIVKLHSLSLKAMIAEAFNVEYWQIEGSESWMEQTRYEVTGKPPDEIARTMPDTRHTWYTINDPMLREMLQNLLMERFALKVHRSTKPGKVYLLERAGDSLALQPKKNASAEQPAPGGRFGSIGFAGDRWGLYDITMPQLAEFASAFVLHRPVLDRTGLAGAFDFQSEPEDFNTHAADPNGSFLRLLKQTGLKLKPGIGDVETIVIEHAELPTSN